MRILCLGMVKNEADIIEAFVRHTAEFVDQICLLENGSTDDTPAILAGLVAEGLPLAVLPDPVRGYHQAEKMTFLYRRAVPLFRPDFVLLLDADEFLDAPDRAALEAVLRAIPRGRYGQLPWRNYVPRTEDLAAPLEDPPRQLRFCVDRRWDMGRGKAAVRCDQAAPEAVWVQQGNHQLAAEGLRPWRLRGLDLAHFPARGIEQVKQKVVFGYLAYAQRDREADGPRYGGHWRSGGQRLVAGAELGPADVRDVALSYARLDAARAEAEGALVEKPLEARYRLARGQRPLVSALSSLARAYILETGGAPDPVVAALAGYPGRATVRADLPPLRYLRDRLRPASVLELGCGAGAHLLDFAAAGVEDLVGLDGALPPDGGLVPGRIRVQDLVKPLHLGRRFDLVLSLGAAAGLAPAARKVLLDGLVRHAGGVIAFAAGQGGPPLHRWIAGFAVRGWHPRLRETLSARLCASFPWLRGGLLVLGRETPADPAEAGMLAALPPPPEEPLPAVVLTPMAGFDRARFAVPDLPEVEEPAAAEPVPANT